MKKLLGILVLGLLVCSSNFVDAKSSELINTIMKKNENFNLGIKKGDTTINGLKLRIHTKKESYLNAVKNNYGWIDYGYQIVYADDVHLLDGEILRNDLNYIFMTVGFYIRKVKTEIV